MHIVVDQRFSVDGISWPRSSFTHSANIIRCTVIKCAQLATPAACACSAHVMPHPPLTVEDHDEKLNWLHSALKENLNTFTLFASLKTTQQRRQLQVTSKNSNAHVEASTAGWDKYNLGGSGSEGSVWLQNPETSQGTQILDPRAESRSPRMKESHSTRIERED